jgi:ABC-type branched-subunit amino acid transport system substrate-binding protein
VKLRTQGGLDKFDGDDKMKITPVSVILAILLVASLAGGIYFGYQSGNTDARKQLEPELQRQININANITMQNEVLNKALYNATNMNTVKIGYIASSPTDLEIASPLIEQIIQPDLNEYASKLGYNVTFQFVIVDALGQDNVHLQKIQELKKMGVNLVISGGFSSMLSPVLSYVNDRNMLLVGVTSTSPWGLSIPNDHLFRMLPTTSDLPNALAGIMWSYGVKEVIIIQGERDDLAPTFIETWRMRGGELAGDPISLPPDQTDFSSYLQAANVQAQAAKAKYPDGDRVAILLLALPPDDDLIVSQIKDYQPLYDCVMFSGYSHIGLRMLDPFFGNPQAIHLKIFTPYPRPFSSSVIDELKSRAPNNYSRNYLNDQGAYLYDSAWAIASSVLETRSTDASVVAGVFPDVCGRLNGASGWCRLDPNGDRAPLPFDVWFYTQYFRSYAGLYEPDTDTMNWNIGETISTPYGP